MERKGVARHRRSESRRSSREDLTEKHLWTRIRRWKMLFGISSAMKAPSAPAERHRTGHTDGPDGPDDRAEVSWLTGPK